MTADTQRYIDSHKGLTRREFVKAAVGRVLILGGTGAALWFIDNLGRIGRENQPTARAAGLVPDGTLPVDIINLDEMDHPEAEKNGREALLETIDLFGEPTWFKKGEKPAIFLLVDPKSAPGYWKDENGLHYIRTRSGSARILKHEMTHFILSDVPLSDPTWREGWAQMAAFLEDEGDSTAFLQAFSDVYDKYNNLSILTRVKREHFSNTDIEEQNFAYFMAGMAWGRWYRMYPDSFKYTVGKYRDITSRGAWPGEEDMAKWFNEYSREKFSLCYQQQYIFGVK